MSIVIPQPKNIAPADGYCSFKKEGATFFASSRLSRIADMLENVMKCRFTESAESPNLSFIYDPDEDREGYSISINVDGAKVFASEYQGAFYGLQTLRQLFNADLPNQKELRARFTTISRDKPEYRWRGLQLDESRHFFGKDTVKKLLDFMAMYKLNVFHWHLTDDQGWRIEIDKYPLLTEIGSKRTYTQVGNWRSRKCDRTPVSGYYTKADISEIVAYAKERCIDIVPEIDFPAHSAAAIASYNYLACREIECEVPGYFGGVIPVSKGNIDWNRTLCLGKDEVYRFVFDVIDEVVQLFPFEYFHVGGDEAPTKEWKKCPLCQKKIKENGLADEVALQGYFTNQVNQHLKKHGKTLIGWNEVLKADLLDRDVVAQYWTKKRDERVTDHINSGGKIIMSCHRAFYFDMRHTYVTLKNTYTFDPLKNNVPKDKLSSVLGLEGENWTEWTDSEEQLFFKLSVRTLALAENAWSSPEAKDYGSFCKRLQHHKAYMDALGMPFVPELAMHRAPVKKSVMAIKAGTKLGNFDCEYKISKM